jgi:hypothetical protein
VPTLAASFQVNSAASDISALTTSSFTPAAGDVIVVKAATETDTSTFSTPTDSQGNTYTLRASDASANHCWVGIWTAVAASATSMTVSVSNASVPAFHSMAVERWTSASLAGTPATNGTKTGTGAPSASLTTTAASSAVSWANGDWAANSPAGRTYNTTSATPTDEGVHDKSPGNYVAYYAYQTAASAGSQTFGITAPTGQTWTLLGIEILHSAGAPAGSTGYDQRAPYLQAFLVDPTWAAWLGQQWGDVATSAVVADVAGASTASATVTASRSDAGAVAGTSTAAATVTAARTDTAAVSGAVTAAGTVTAARTDVGTVAGTVTASGTLTAARSDTAALSRTVTASASVVANVSSPASVLGLVTASAAVTASTPASGATDGFARPGDGSTLHAGSGGGAASATGGPGDGRPAQSAGPGAGTQANTATGGDGTTIHAGGP